MPRRDLRKAPSSFALSKQCSCLTSKPKFGSVNQRPIAPARIRGHIRSCSRLRLISRLPHPTHARPPAVRDAKLSRCDCPELNHVLGITSARLAICAYHLLAGRYSSGRPSRGFLMSQRRNKTMPGARFKKHFRDQPGGEFSVATNPPDAPPPPQRIPPPPGRLPRCVL